jgi:hypothetical protein
MKIFKKIGVDKIVMVVCIVAAIIIAVTYTPTSEPIKGSIPIDKVFETQSNYVSIITISGCEYLLVKVGKSISVVHREDCSNPLHKNKGTGTIQ